jgi:hypothetical protein
MPENDSPATDPPLKSLEARVSAIETSLQKSCFTDKEFEALKSIASKLVDETHVGHLTKDVLDGLVAKLEILIKRCIP